MKLIIAIVQDEDASRLITNLMENRFSVTKLATTGGFLRAGNTTLLLGVEDERLDEAKTLIEKVCHSRTQMAAVPHDVGGVAAGGFNAMPVEVKVGGATLFVLSVDQFIKL